MSDAALTGLKVVEMCSFVAGPFCARLLGDMGADVVKVEPPGTGDVARTRGPFYESIPGPDRSLLFTYLNFNKRGVTLDPSSPTGREMLMGLLGKADLLVEDLHPTVTQKLGLGYEELHSINPRLVVTSVTPFGRTGPYREHTAYYLNTYHSGGDGYLLPGGRLADSLYPEGEPIAPGGYLGEYQAGVGASVATMAALLGRMMDGRSRHVDASKQEALIVLNSGDFCLYPDRGYMENRRNRHLAHYTGGLYRCKDGFWELLIPSQRHWDAMMEAMGNPEWARDEMFTTQDSRVEHRAQVDERVEEWAMGYTRQEIYHTLQAQGCAAGPVYSTEELLEDPQMAHRGFFADVEHPAIGPYKTPSAAYRMSETPWEARLPAPSLGQHNAEVYGDLGHDGRDLARLRQAGVI